MTKRAKKNAEALALLKRIVDAGPYALSTDWSELLAIDDAARKILDLPARRVSE